MKQFFEQYGGVALGILALLVLIAMITPVGNIIKTSLQGTVTKFSGSMNGQLDDAMNATATAQNSASGFEMNFSPNPGPETPVVPGTPNPEPETPVTPPVEPVTPENYDGYVTEPGTYFIDMLCRNQDQPSGYFPFPYCVNYEVNVYDGLNWTGWLDNTEKPGFDKNGSDTDFITIYITQEMLDEANGKLYLDWQLRAAMSPSFPFEKIGQPIRVKVGRIEADDSQTIFKCFPYNGASTCS